MRKSGFNAIPDVAEQFAGSGGWLAILRFLLVLPYCLPEPLAIGLGVFVQEIFNFLIGIAKNPVAPVLYSMQGVCIHHMRLLNTDELLFDALYC